jgi:hypothetical protein
MARQMYAKRFAQRVVVQDDYPTFMTVLRDNVAAARP